MKLYKLTEQDYTTYEKKMSWSIGKTNKVKKSKNPKLRTNTVIHAYKNKNLAILLNPIHADINEPVMLECEGDIVVENWGKCGVFELTPKRKLYYPKWHKNIETREDVQLYFAILCAESVINVYETYKDDTRPRKAIEAAKKYLKDKSKKNADAARAAANAANAAAYAIDFCKLADEAVEYIMNVVKK